MRGRRSRRGFHHKGTKSTKKTPEEKTKDEKRWKRHKANKGECAMAHSPEEKERADQLSRIILGAAIEVHRHLGPGLLESA